MKYGSSWVLCVLNVKQLRLKVMLKFESFDLDSKILIKWFTFFLSIKEFCLKLNLKPGQKVLDLGCGTGGSAFFLARHYGAVVHGIDLSSNMILLAEDRRRREEETIKKRVRSIVFLQRERRICSAFPNPTSENQNNNFIQLSNFIVWGFMRRDSFYFQNKAKHFAITSGLKLKEKWYFTGFFWNGRHTWRGLPCWVIWRHLFQRYVSTH